MGYVLNFVFCVLCSGSFIHRSPARQVWDDTLVGDNTLVGDDTLVWDDTQVVP